MPVRIVAATRLPASEAGAGTLLGRCLASLAWDEGITCSMACGNEGDQAHGLGEIYNRFINERHAHEIVVFTHDDVSLDDYFLRSRLNEAMATYDVVGIAGNTRAEPDDVSWFFRLEGAHEQRVRVDPGRLSGTVAHLDDNGKRTVSHYGPSPRSCQRLDGCFLAVHVASLLQAGVRFDEQFRFHGYDMDFSRACHEAGLRMGTWPLAITHASGGNFNSASWRRAALRYREKWASKPN